MKKVMDVMENFILLELWIEGSWGLSKQQLKTVLE